MASNLEATRTALLEARRRHGAIAASLPGPRDASDAYRLQALVAAELGPVAAWKTGAPSPEAEPIMAPIFAELVHRSPARLDAAGFHRIGIEAEIAYRLGRDLPARDAAYGRDEVMGAIDGVLAAIEIVDTRLPEPLLDDPWWRLADFQINGGLVVGEPRTAWRTIDPMAQPVQLAIDSVTVARGRGGNPAGDPLRLMVWLANHCGDHCGGLRRGQVVTTGSLTGLRWVEPGAVVVARLAGLGAVQVSFPR
jgi:2-keto-4-pentenoate hydratase